MEKNWLDDDARRLIASCTSIIFAQSDDYSTINQEHVRPALAYLWERKRGFSSNDAVKFIQDERSRNTVAYALFFGNIFPKIAAFARTDAETDALVITLLEETLKTISRPIYTEMERKGLMPRDINICGMDK